MKSVLIQKALRHQTTLPSSNTRIRNWPITNKYGDDDDERRRTTQHKEFLTCTIAWSRILANNKL